MPNGSNDWDVTFSKITFLRDILATHGNVVSFSRDKDILFSIKRRKQQDFLQVLCLEEYSCGTTAMRRALAEFGALSIIYVGGSWCGYTPQAKEDCIRNQIGLYNSTEITGGLWSDQFWSYAKRDKDGNKMYQYKTA